MSVKQSALSWTVPSAKRGRKEQLPHLSHRGLLVPQPHDEDAVGLADAALGPGGQGAVSLVQHNPVDVLLLAQPAGQSVLVDAGDRQGKQGIQLVLHHSSQENRGESDTGRVLHFLLSQGLLPAPAGSVSPGFTPSDRYTKARGCSDASLQ